ncbi:outer membrane protein [Enterobacter cloacae]|nr:outer membrane protein [Enterobacter cloacae]
MQKCKTLKGLLIASSVAAMFSTVGVHAQATSAAQSDASAQTSSTGSMAKLSSGDEKALKDMAQANINEVAAAKIALDKAQSSEVKAFAQKMVDDHGNALTKVQTVAKQKDVTLPTEPDAQHKAMADKLGKESGDAFDKMYMENAGTKDHKMVLSKLQSDAKNIKDPDVKALADEHTPVVEMHLKAAEQMKMPADK